MRRLSLRASRDRRDERGSVTIEHAILLPALFAVMFLGMQVALYYHARVLAIAAASEGAHAASAEGGRDADGVRAANGFLASAGYDAINSTSTTVNRAVTTVTVTVTGHSLSVIPGWNPTITQSATLPIEKLSTP